MITPHLPKTIEHIATDALIPYARNSRTHSPEQVEQLGRSIQQFGFTNPVLIDEHNTLIAGHGRVMAAQRIGLEVVPAIRLLHLTDAQRRAYVIADNKLAEQAGWDMGTLAREVEDLMAESFDVSLLGFGNEELAALLDERGTEPEGSGGGNTDDDAVPEVAVEPVTVLGDVWVMGKHRLMCGDSTSMVAVQVLLDGGVLDAIVTDPPYGIGIDGQKCSKSKNPKHNRKAHEFMGWDAERPDASVFRYIVNAKVPACIWGGNYFADLLPPSRGWLYWSKGQDGLTMSDGELAWTTQTSPLRSVTVNRAVLQGSVRPTQKPLQVIEFSLEYLKAGPVVLDLFGGSGSTLIACQKTARQARLMELEPKYCDVIVKRWQDFTGQQATLEGDGRTFAQVAAERGVALEV